jgi:hypothetical protein
MESSSVAAHTVPDWQAYLVFKITLIMSIEKWEFHIKKKGSSWLQLKVVRCTLLSSGSQGHQCATAEWGLPPMDEDITLPPSHWVPLVLPAWSRGAFVFLTLVRILDKSAFQNPCFSAWHGGSGL